LQTERGLTNEIFTVFMYPVSQDCVRRKDMAYTNILPALFMHNLSKTVSRNPIRFHPNANVIYHAAGRRK
jgi:hypothetical protein